MHNVQLPDRLYENAQRTAEAGFASVDDYVADVLAGDLQSDTPNLDYFFTSDRLAKIDEADAQVEVGKCFSPEQVGMELAKRKEQWISQNNGQ